MREEIGRRARTGVFVRSFAVQGSWNYKTLIGAGFAFALLPALRAVYAQDPDRLRAAVRRHSELFNSHPYLTPVALGAVAALEAEGADAAQIDRFKMAVRGALGSLGDSLVWAGWRPVCLLLGLALLLMAVPWWAAVIVFLVVYNAGHVGLRAWALSVGLREGRRVAGRLQRSWLRAVAPWLDVAGAFLTGVVLVPAVAGALVGHGLPAAGVVVGGIAALVGLAVGSRIRGPVVASLAGFAVLGVLFTLV